MKNTIEEIKLYYLRSTYSDKYKNMYKQRLEYFLNYLAQETCTPPEEVHLEKIYETVNAHGKAYFFSMLDIALIEKFFLDHLHKSYHWLHLSRRALQSFFLYLNRKYEFPILTDEMNLKVDDYKQKPQERDKYVPTRHDLLKFLQSVLKKSSCLQRDLVFFLLLMTTGSRPSEILNIRVNEIDFVNETIYRKQTKNKSSKFIILRDGFGEALQRYTDRYNLKDDDYLFNDNGRKMDLNELQELFAFFLRDANLPFTTLHKLRHSFATIMAESGAAILVIQQILGHDKLHSTKTYIDSNYIRNDKMELQVNKEVYKHIR